MIGIIVPTWGRERLVRIAQRQLRRALAESGMDAVVVIVGSETTTSEHVAEQCGADHYIEARNILTDKLNVGIEWALAQGVDGVIGLGSDDLISARALATIKHEAEQGADLVGHLDFYRLFPDSVDRPLRYWPGYTSQGPAGHHRWLETVGTGRYYSRRLIECVGQIWQPGLKCGADGSATERTAPHVMRTVTIRQGLDGVDLCGVQEQSLTSWHKENAIVVDPALAVASFGAGARELLGWPEPQVDLTMPELEL